MEQRLRRLVENPSFPRSAGYDPRWVAENMMGPNVLWLTEALTQILDLEPGSRVLDLGCGRAMSSIFLAREYGVQVWAADLWIRPWDNWGRILQAGVEDKVFPIHTEAHRLPFSTGFFDVIVSLDAYHYFGTDDCYIGYITRFLKPDGRLGIVVPALTREMDEVPAELAPHWSWDFWSFHPPDWWRRRWERSGLVEVERADLLPDGWRHWVQSDRGSGWDKQDVGWVAALEADAGRTFGFSRLVARRSASRAGAAAVGVIEYRRNHAIDNDEYNALRLRAWGRDDRFDWSPVLAHSLGWITAYADGRLIGFVNVAWDGGAHMFLLDTSVDPEHQRRGIGTELVRRAIEIGVEAGGDWMHVDSDEMLMRDFYGRCGFEPTPAGLVNLRDPAPVVEQRVDGGVRWLMAKPHHGRVLLLIGPSSVGKTAIAKELQRLLEGPWLLAGVDRFWGMLDEKALPVGDFRTDSDAMRRVTRGWHRAVAALAAEGNDVIVDDLGIHRWWLDDWNQVLGGLRWCSVLLKAGLNALMAREAQRGDRPVGLAAADLAMAPEDRSFDLVIDTEGRTVADCLAAITDLIRRSTATQGHQP